MTTDRQQFFATHARVHVHESSYIWLSCSLEANPTITLRSLVHLKQKEKEKKKGALKHREYHTLVSSDPDIKREPFEFQAIEFTQP